MGNNRTGANQRIKNICRSKSIDEMTLYAKAKLLLEIYRDVCWDTADYAMQIQEDALYEYEFCSEDLNAALLYLENFAPTEKKERFTEKVQKLFEVKWMIEIVDHAIAKVRKFPTTGEMYASMLSAYYLTSFPLTEAEMMDEFGLERSTLYRRKKEAIKVFGLAIWGGPIEEFRALMLPDMGEQMTFDAWI
jgi:hypothetical protein